MIFKQNIQVLKFFKMKLLAKCFNTNNAVSQAAFMALTFECLLQKIQLFTQMKQIAHFFLWVKIIWIICTQINTQNIICNGGFDGYSLNSSYNGELFQQINSDPKCWFNQNGGTIEIKQKVTPAFGNICQLVTKSIYTLCQCLTLQVNQTYQLTFTAISCRNTKTAYITAKVANSLVLNLSLAGQYMTNTSSKNFTALATNQTLCFDGVMSRVNILDFTNYYDGPQVDNISVTKVSTSITPTNTTTNTTNSTNATNTTNTTNTSNTNTTTNTNTTVTNPTNQTSANNTNYTNSTDGSATGPSSPVITPPVIPLNVTINSSLTNISLPNLPTIITPPLVPSTSQILQIYCNTDPNVQELIVLNCRYPYTGIKQYLQQVYKFVQIYLQGEFQDSITFTSIQDYSMTLQIVPKRLYNMKKIYLVLPDYINQFQNFKIKFYVNGAELAFVLLSQEQALTIKTVYPVAEDVIKLSGTIYSVLKASFLSFFLLDIISFWNLSLMYNFLNIPTVPSFSKYFLEKLIYNFYQLGSVLAWLQQKVPQVKILLASTQTTGSQQMQNFFFGYAWFGTFGFSTIFLYNNSEQLMMLTFLIFKILIIKSLRIMLSRKFPIFRKYFPKGIKLLQIFLKQAIGLVIFISVSAGTCITNPGISSWNQIFNIIVQILTLFICISILPLYFLTQVSVKFVQISKKSEKITKRQIESKKQMSLKILQFFNIKNSNNRKKRKVVLTCFSNILQIIPFVTIPIFVILQNLQLFFIVNTVVIALRIFCFAKYRTNLTYSCRQKLFLFINLFIWFLHHSTYILLWVFSKVWTRQSLDEPTQNTYPSDVISILKICGLITIFTVIGGGILEIINFITSVIGQIIIFLKKIVKKCRQKRNNIKKLSVIPTQYASTNKDKKLQKISPYIDKQIGQACKTNQIVISVPKQLMLGLKKKLVVKIKQQKRERGDKIQIKATETGLTHHTRSCRLLVNQ